MQTRRTFTKAMLAAFPSAALLAKPFWATGPVVIGIQAYSFRDRSFDAMIEAMPKVGANSLDLFSGHFEPPQSAGPEAARKWRTSPDTLLQMKEARGKLDKAGLRLEAYGYNFQEEWTEEEVDFGFRMAGALGTRYLTTSSHVSMAARLDAAARKHNCYIGMHNHDRVERPNDVATPESFEKVTAGHPNIMINLDIGHFVAANYDPIAFIKTHHARILTVHLKDRKRNHGPNVPFGQGDTPIAGVLRLDRDMRYHLPMNVEYEYKGADTVVEVKRCIDYCKAALA